jgi:ubiquinone/menaquinone biosynthesis C-methylase UbiE
MQQRRLPADDAEDAVDSSSDAAFGGLIAALYEQRLVPLIFEPYAGDLATRAEALRPGRVLEIAAGTGVVTRRLARLLPADVEIVATDLNVPMLDQATAIGTTRTVQWRQADAMQLPFDDASFDLVVCQHGVMFFPDRRKAYMEARRVLKPGGTLLFNAWDRIEHNQFADVVTNALAAVFPDDPPRFLARVPHGYYDKGVIAAELAAAGFAAPRIETLAARSRADTARIPAIAYCQGTPLRNEIAARDPARMAEATQAATDAIARRFGDGPVNGKIQAHVVQVAKP